MAEKKRTVRERPVFPMLRSSDDEAPDAPDVQTVEQVVTQAIESSDAEAAQPSNVQIVDRSNVEMAEPSDTQAPEDSDTQTTTAPISSKALYRKRKGKYRQPMTIYLEPEDVRALNRYQFEYADRTGESIEKSEVVRQALRAWLGTST
jgi:hypothetical protein